MVNNIKYTQQAWRLDELFSGVQSAEFKQAIENVDRLLTEMEAFQPELDVEISEENFLAVLDNYDGLTRQLSRLGGFVQLSFSANTQDQEIVSFLPRVRQIVAESSNRLLFFELWWKELDGFTTQRLLAASGDYGYWLESLQREKPFTLSEAEERVVNLKNVNGRSALQQLYTTITSRYEFELEIDGELKKMTRGELASHYQSSDPKLRAAAYQELYRVYSQDAPILGQIYQTLVRDWRSENVQLRNFETPIAVRNLANDIPDEVVNTLLDVSKANASLFQRYFRLKAKWMGVEKLRRYDIYAPLVKTEQSYAFEDAVDLVLTSFHKFDPNIAKLARRVFDEGHLDSEVRPGKRGGAFCATITPDLTPWVLQSFHGKPNNVATLAHELGHAVHAMLAEHHTALTQQSSLPLAETASTFGEMLLVDHMLAENDAPEVEREILFAQMDDAYGTIMRQIFFALFERDAHEAIHNNASVEELNALYLENLKTQFGDSVEISDDFKYEWIVIPHIYSVPFYVYAYAFGQLLVLSLYEQFLQEGDAFKPRYVEILAAGGSEAPVKILERAGIDIYSAEFWQGGFDVLAKLLERLEALPKD